MFHKNDFNHGKNIILISPICTMPAFWANTKTGTDPALAHASCRRHHLPRIKNIGKIDGLKIAYIWFPVTADINEQQFSGLSFPCLTIYFWPHTGTVWLSPFAIAHPS
ncbi:MAG: hypothetical protein ACXV7F_06800 [Methylomonas sp.]